MELKGSLGFRGVEKNLTQIARINTKLKEICEIRVIRVKKLTG